MPRLVTGVFYDRSEAERAVETLKAQGIPSEDIYLETELEPTTEVGSKGGEVSRLENERRFAGLETGLVIGGTVGCLAGLGVGMLGAAMKEMITSIADPDNPIAMLTPMVAHPMWSAIGGALLGLIAGGLIGWIIDFTLTRMGAGPPLPAQETLVTVRTTDDRMNKVSGTLFRSRARHLHVAEAGQY
jgi:hypothetical protein